MSEPEHTPPPSPPPIPDYHTGTDPLAATPPAIDFVNGNLPDGNLASPWIRLAAAIIDGIVWTIGYMILAKILFPATDQAVIQAAIARGDYQVLADAAAAADPGFIKMLLASAVSTAIFIGINWKFLPEGQTIGKKLLKIQIQSRNGGLLPVNDLILRRILPVYIAGRLGTLGGLLYIVDALCIFRPNRNTLHDDLANSKVVQLPGAPF